MKAEHLRNTLQDSLFMKILQFLEGNNRCLFCSRTVTESVKNHTVLTQTGAWRARSVTTLLAGKWRYVSRAWGMT